MSRRILVVDDNRSIRETFLGHLPELGYEALGAESGEEALNVLQRFGPALVITDLRMPGMSGLELLARIKACSPDTTVVVITAHEDMQTAVGAMKAGAYDYLVKPLDIDQIDMLVERCFREQDQRRRVEHLSGEAAEPYALDRMVGRDPAMIQVYKLIGTLATNRTSVLIRGETGTGKEVVARAIHFNSPRASEPFVAINCTAIPESLLESELFGHLRGAFTGAASDRRGHFERAGTGTIFLDEIGDTSPAFQTKLLRVLEGGEFYPVGADRPRRTEARVIAATHRDLEDLVRKGEFREDLYFRLRVVEIEVPPLRARRGDIPLLAQHLLARLGRELHRNSTVIPDAVLSAMQQYDWPGNVRELENTLTRALVLSRGPVLEGEHVVLGSARSAQRPDPPESDLSFAAAEKSHLLRVLRHTNGNKRRAARLLRISRSRMDRLMVRHGIPAAQTEAAGPDF